MSVVTKRGDQGKTDLFTIKGEKPRREDKSSTIFEILGAIDEVNSYLGVVISQSKNSAISKKLQRIQSDLFFINSSLSGADININENIVSDLEKDIYKMESTLPPLKHFILPGGDSVAANIFYLRALTRRAERCLVSLSKKQKVSSVSLMYLNRLSDYFFILARKINYSKGKKEYLWTGRER